MIAENSDRGWHTPGAELAWSESVGFRFADPASRLGVVARLGVHPNEGSVDVAIDIFMPDGSFVAVRQIGPWRDGVAPLIEGFEIQAVESEDRWRLFCDGAAHSLPEAAVADQPAAWKSSRIERVILELEWQACAEPLQSGGGGTRFTQAGRMRGEMWVSGDHFILDVPALRDRSWGPRRLELPESRALLCCLADGEGGFEIETLRREGESAPGTSGWIVIGGEARALSELELVEDGEGSAVQGLRASLGLLDAAKLSREARVIVMAPLPGRRNDAAFLLRECFVEWAGEGGTALGFAELLSRT